MANAYVFSAGVGNDFIMPKPKFRPTLVPEATPAMATTVSPSAISYENYRQPAKAIFPINWRAWGWLNVIDRHKLAILAMLLIITVGVSSQAMAPYWYDHLYSRVSSLAKNISQPVTINGKAVANSALTLELPASQLTKKIHAIVSQPIELTVGSNQPVTVSSTVINSWLQVAENNAKTEGLIVVNPTAVSNSIVKLADQYVVTPVNSVIAVEDGVTTTILPGTNGTELASPSTLASQASMDAKNLISGKGFQLSALLVTAPSQVTPLASLGKVLDVNVTTKRMYAYSNGQLANTFLVTAGAPATPTPIGEFHIWEKMTVQNMSGLNPDGSKYFQPSVPWINYFDHSGDAVHGNYWRPASYFGSINSSHGCVGVQVPEAEWIYNWAPIGTTVITHA
jgi:lipoprotein-anchoring transpeptidase ErfK/SrfK